MKNSLNRNIFALAILCGMSATVWAAQKCSPENRTEKTCVPQRFDCNKDGQCKTRDICTTKTVTVQRCYSVPDSSSRNSSSRNSGAQ